jgi:malate synthase
MATIATRNEIETQILTPEASRFLTRMAREFEPRRRELLERRRTRQMETDAGALPGFLPETAHIRESAWTVAPIPQDLLDRRVEITGPVDRKMIINALNSGASVFMADFEDSNSPTWTNNLEGQANLRDAVEGTIGFVSPEGKRYQLNDRVATLLVRPGAGIWTKDISWWMESQSPVPYSTSDSTSSTMRIG